MHVNTLLQICNCIYMNPRVFVLMVSHLQAFMVFVSRIKEIDTFYQR